MKAPDTIYIPIVEEEGKKLLCTNWWETDTSSRNAYVNETIPYIRKDAILEWANKRTETIPDLGFDNGDTEYGYMRAIENLIEHINSL